MRKIFTFFTPTAGRKTTQNTKNFPRGTKKMGIEPDVRQSFCVCLFSSDRPIVRTHMMLTGREADLLGRVGDKLWDKSGDESPWLGIFPAAATRK